MIAVEQGRKAEMERLREEIRELARSANRKERASGKGVGHGWCVLGGLGYGRVFPLRRRGTTNRTERKTQAEVVQPDLSPASVNTIPISAGAGL